MKAVMEDRTPRSSGETGEEKDRNKEGRGRKDRQKKRNSKIRHRLT